jgi:hypothetical protein
MDTTVCYTTYTIKATFNTFWVNRSKYTSSDLTLIPLRPEKRLLLEELPPQGYMLGAGYLGSR